MKEIPQSFNIPRYRQMKHGNAFWKISLGVLLFMMLSLILLTNLNNFVLTSETRNMLLEIKAAKNQDTPINQESTTIKTGFTETTQAVPETTPEKTTKLSSQTSSNSTGSTITFTTIPPHITTGVTGTNEFASTSTPTDSLTSSEEISTTSELNSTEPAEKRNPITVLTEVNQFKKNFTRTESCNDPSIYTAHLKLKLSANSENYLLLTTQVLTTDAQVAKRKVAYLALIYLYKDHLYEAQTDAEWDLWIGPCRDESQNNTQISF